MRMKINIIAIMAIMMLFVPIIAGSVIAQEVEIRGTIMDGDGKYDYTNSAFFWYDLDKNQSSEVMIIEIDNRTIEKGSLEYKCIPKMIDYKSPGLKTNYDQYKIIGFMAEKYICYDNKTDKLVKLLIEWGSNDKIVLSMGNSMEFPEGYVLSAAEIDLQGNKVWLKLYKDGECVDNSLIEGGDTYVYEDKDDILQFSCEIDTVFRGTESNMVIVKYVFMRSDDILDLDGGDNFGVMEVKSTSSAGIILKNDETVTLDRDSEIEIMSGLYFKVADSTQLRYYLAKIISLDCPECPACPMCPVCNESEPCPEVTPEVTIEYVNVTVIPDDIPEKTVPGFEAVFALAGLLGICLLYTSPSPRDVEESRMPSSA